MLDMRLQRAYVKVWNGSKTYTRWPWEAGQRDIQA